MTDIGGGSSIYLLYSGSISIIKQKLYIALSIYLSIAT